jgi:RNA polymerase sigma-70 factor (ECF subfamily)
MAEFEKLANQHKDAVYRQLIRACGNREDAEDVLIEALLKAYQHMDQLRDELAFRGWLAQIGKRVCWQLKEKEALRPILQLSMLEDNGEQIAGNDLPAESQIALKRMKQLLAAAVASVPEEARTVFELRDIEELSGEEVARRLHISLAAMKSRLHRAREQVRKYMDAALADSRAAIS